MEDNQNVVCNALPGVPDRDGSTGQLSTETIVTLVSGTGGAIVSAATPLPVQAGMEDAVADRADDTACQSATDDRHQQCEHGIADDYIIPRHGKSQV
jgi:hypothetical protein